MPQEQLDLSSNKPVLSWANHQLDNKEAQMAKNVASLPFVFKHVALMPDVHLGKGALVGSVIATKDAVIPAAVGVDIGCFTGDTKIPLLDGKEYEIAEGVECRKDSKIIDEIPGAYKPIEEVMANQSDLVEVVATLKQVVCVKG